MQTSLFTLFIAAAILMGCGHGKPIVPTDRPCADLEKGPALFASWVDDPSAIPVSFTYAGVPHEGLKGFDILSNTCLTTASGKSLKAVFSIDENLQAKVEAALNNEFGEIEYTVWFENIGSSPSGELKDLESVVLNFDGGDPMIRGCLGDHVNKYADYQTLLRDTTVSFVSTGGRATHVYFPYFDLVHGDGGTLMAWVGPAHGTPISLAAMKE